MLLPSAFSMWNIGSFGFTFSGEKTDARAVAVVSNAPAVLYTSVERAVEVANSQASSSNPLTVYVLPHESGNSSTVDGDGFVLPIYISEDLQVKANVTLRLPYEYDYSGGTITINQSESTAQKTSGAFADSTAANVKANRRTQLVIADGKTLTIDSGASLYVDGIVGANGAGTSNVNGQTCNLYTEISLGRGSSINMNGHMEVKGYVKPFDESYDDTCSLEVGKNATGSVMKLPLVIYDFVGGSAALTGSYEMADTGDKISAVVNISNWDGCLWQGIFPLETFDFPNVSVPFSCHAGSSIVSFYDLFLNNTHVTGEIPLLSSSQSVLVFKNSSGSDVATVDFDPAIGFEKDGRTEGLTYQDRNYLRNPSSGIPGSSDASFPNVLLGDNDGAATTRMILEGDFSTGDIELYMPLVDTDMIDQTVNTAGGFIGADIPFIGKVGKDYPRLAFPFSYKWTLESKSGSVVIPTACKFLPGSALIVNEGAELTVDSGGALVFLEEVETPTSSYYPASFKDSHFINNGTLTVLNGGSLGGTIHTFDSNNGEYDESAVSFVVFESENSSDYQVGVHSIGWKTTNSSGRYEYSEAIYDAKGYLATAVGSPLISEEPISLYGQGKAFSGHLPSPVSYGKGYFVKDKVDIKSVVISVNGSVSTEPGENGDFTVVATALPEDNGSTIVSYDWEVSPDSDVTITPIDEGSAKIKIPASVDKEDKPYKVSVSVRFVKSDGTSASISSNTITLVAKGKEDECLSGDTEVRMADGSIKRLDSISCDDDILAWDHVSGRVVSTKASIVFHHDYGLYDSIVLRFDDGSKLEVLNAHELFDITTNSYVSIDGSTYSSYIGHSFAKMKGGPGSASYESVRLISADVSMKQTNAYSIQSARYINFLACDFLTRTTPPIDGWFDYFELGENLTYDPVKMQADIEKYGLYEYETFKPYGVSYQQFIDFNGPWLKVLVGKGVVTFEQIIDLIYEYVV